MKVAIVLLLAAIGLGLRETRSAASPANALWNPDIRYLDPVALALSPDGSRLYVVCTGRDLVLAVNTRTRFVVGRVQVGRKPEGIAVSPDGKTLYVTNEWSDSVSEIDASSFHVRRTLKTGWNPVGVTTGREGKFLYTANTLGDDISVINLATGKEVKRLAGGHFPEYVALSRNGKWVYVSNLLARVAPPDDPPLSQLTVVSTAKQIVTNHIMVPGVIQLRHIAQVPARDGGYLLIPFQQPHNLVPLVQIQQGWYMSHGMAVIRQPRTDAQKARVMEVLLDNIDQAFADGFGAACAPDGRVALVTASGANVVSVIDIAKLNQLLKQVPASDPEALAHRLDSARQFVVRRLKTGRNPTAVVISPDSHFAYIANRTDDTVTVVDLKQLKVASTINLGGPREITVERRGEQLFFDARFCYQDQLACASCHPHVGFEDGLVWSLETPELGRDVVENRTLLDIAGTSPFDWPGINPDLETQDGPRTAELIFRSQGFSPTQVRDLVTYIRSLKLPPNPHLAPDGHLTHAQEMGRKLFFRTKTNNGTIIPLYDRCYYCHSPLTHYTSRVLMDVGTSTKYDTVKSWDVPQLQGAYMRAPYLHNGEAMTLEGIWTKYNPDDKHGITSDMTKIQLSDLIEFLKAL
ncbi:MAG: beta-propeller fold lactonase family protein [Acidobacteriota bacterium]